MKRVKEVICKQCFKKIATIDRSLEIVEEKSTSRSHSSYPVGPNTIDEVTLTCECGHTTPLCSC